MAYGVKVSITADDLYERLSPSDKERFDEVVISDVKRDGNSVIIEGILIEKRNYDRKMYKELSSKDIWPLSYNNCPSICRC